MDIRTFWTPAGKNRYALFASACLIPATCIQPAFAAEEPEEVIVTGSRIRQSPVERAAPVQTATAADIDRSGEISVADYLQRLPISGSAINRANNASGNLGFPPDGGGIGAGASEIDLRYLTSKRVLVLVDGRRWVRGSSGSGVSGAVDLNTIPTAAIERIEVLQDGASPIYGSDAIAGVVNVITKSDFDGFEFETNQAMYDEGDGYTQDYSLSWGSNGDKTNTFLSVGYSRQDPVFSGDRELSRCVLFGASACNFNGSSGIPQGRFTFLDPRGDCRRMTVTEPDVIDIVLDTGATGANYDPNNPGGADWHNFSNDDRFNFRPFNYLATPNRRVNVFGKAAYDVSDSVELTFTASFTNRESSGQAAPNPLFMGSGAGAGFFLDNVFIPADHPFNPFGIDLGPDGAGGNNLTQIARRPVEAGPRMFDQKVDTWMLSGALTGDLELGGRTHYWDVSLNWGRNNASQTGFNIFNARKLALALGPVDACDRDPGCVPFNIFGGAGTITPEMLAWATFTQNDSSNQELNDVAFNLTGELFDLPAGAFAYAFGLENRKERGEFIPDSIAQSGETADVPASATRGQVRVKEAYLELRAPLLANLPAVQRLELSAAVRSSDYDSFGRDEVFKGGLYWRVFNDLSVRANYAEGFRAPNIGELFNTGSRFDSGLDDPCDNYPGQRQSGAHRQLRGARRARHVRAAQSADQRADRRQSRPHAGDVRYLHDRDRLQPVVGGERLLDRGAHVRCELLQHRAGERDPGAQRAGPAQQLRGDAVAALLRRHRSRWRRLDHRVRQSADEHRSHRDRRLRLDVHADHAGVRLRRAALHLGQHLSRELQGVHARRGRPGRARAGRHRAGLADPRLRALQVDAGDRLAGPRLRHVADAALHERHRRDLHGERRADRICAAIRRATSTSWTQGCTRTCRWRGRRRSGISRCSWRWASTTSSTRIRRRAARAT